MSNPNIQPGLMYSGTKISFILAIKVLSMYTEKYGKGNDVAIT